MSDHTVSDWTAGADRTGSETDGADSDAGPAGSNRRIRRENGDGDAPADGDGDSPDGNGDSPDAPADSPDLHPEQMFELLRNSRRRQVLQYLQTHDGPVRLGTLAEHVAAIENDTDPALLSSDQRKSVYVGLYQCHLPKMDGMDVVDFDQRGGTVVLGPNAERVRSPMEAPDQSARWPLAYGSVAAAGLAVTVSLAWRSSRLALAASLLTLVAVVVLSTARLLVDRGLPNRFRPARR